MLNTEFSLEADALLASVRGNFFFFLKLEVANNPTGFRVFNVCFKGKISS